MPVKALRILFFFVSITFFAMSWALSDPVVQNLGSYFNSQETLGKVYGLTECNTTLPLLPTRRGVIGTSGSTPENIKYPCLRVNFKVDGKNLNILIPGSKELGQSIQIVYNIRNPSYAREVGTLPLSGVGIDFLSVAGFLIMAVFSMVVAFKRPFMITKI